jgi:hypothetical protein
MKSEKQTMTDQDVAEIRAELNARGWANEELLKEGKGRRNWWTWIARQAGYSYGTIAAERRRLIWPPSAGIPK